MLETVKIKSQKENKDREETENVTSKHNQTCTKLEERIKVQHLDVGPLL